MNRRAKRNKYRRLQKELEKKYEAAIALAHFSKNANKKEIKVQQISCLKLIEDYSVIPVGEIKELYRKEIAQQIAEEILKHKDYFTITDTGYGYRYDLSIVKIE
jgi:hypothetical protein